MGHSNKRAIMHRHNKSDIMMQEMEQNPCTVVEVNYFDKNWRKGVKLWRANEKLTVCFI